VLINTGSASKYPEAVAAALGRRAARRS